MIEMGNYISYNTIKIGGERDRQRIYNGKNGEAETYCTYSARQ